MKGKRQNYRKSLGISKLILILIALILLVLLGFKIKHDLTWPKLNDYDRSKFQRINGRMYYEKVDDSRTIIDVSSHNGSIDWQAVKADGVEGAMIRLGYRGYTKGGLVEDRYFRRNLSQASEAGLKVGVYFFSQAGSEEEAVEEAEFVKERIKGTKLQFPIVFDMEEIPGKSRKISALTVEQRTKITLAFCREIEATGQASMIYGNRYWLKDKIDISKIGARKVWFAQYNIYPGYKWQYFMWQYTESGKVDGIKNNVDINLLMN